MTYKKYSEDDNDYLEYYLYDGEEKTYTPAAEFLGVSNDQLIKKMSKMRQKNRSIGYIQKPWSKREDEYIRRTYRMMSTKEMSEYLGRTRASIEWRAAKLGIKKLKQLKEYDFEIKRLASEGYYKAQIARKLGLNPKSVGEYINRNQIPCERAPKEVSSKAFKEDELIRHLTVKNKTWLK